MTTATPTRATRTAGSTRGIAGFSMAEVTLAVGILASGLLLLVALLPLAFNTLGTASSNSIERQIADRLIGDLQQSEWEEIADRDGEEHRFDVDGIELGANTLEGLVFVARIGVPERDVRVDHDSDLSSVGASYSLPGEAAPNAFTEGDLRRVIVDLINFPDPDFDFDSPDNAARFRSYAGIVANMGNSDF